MVLAQAEHGLDSIQPVTLDELTRQATREADPGTITVTVETDPVTVLGDPVLLNRLLANLIQNAIRYNHPNGFIHIRLTGGVLTIRNSGPEVPVDRVAELFQPFRRLHSQTRSGEGSGLGLSIVASIAQAHHATLTARPKSSGGLELTVRFQPISGLLPGR